jgi:SAM-dependent methyltransferase
MFVRTAAFYDAVYAAKNYAAETEKLRALIAAHRRSPGNRLLDMACGTGRHMELLSGQFAVEGLDLDAGLLDVARERLPGVALHHGDMIDADLGRQFDVVTCLFSSIGYVVTVERLNAAIANFARHVVPGGVVVVEAWFGPDLKPDRVTQVLVELPPYKISRMGTITVDGRISTLHFHYLIGRPGEIIYEYEAHVMGLFSDDDYRHAFRAAGLEVSAVPEGISGRPVYVGVRPM